ncbi:MAG: hypothetical protein IPJ97_16615 [Proteobacteria bacterium]|nr:hypothetical protein [Pseudomonadota bacterium]
MTESAARPSNVRWRILAILVFVSFVSYLLRGTCPLPVRPWWTTCN